MRHTNVLNVNGTNRLRPMATTRAQISMAISQPAPCKSAAGRAPIESLHNKSRPSEAGVQWPGSKHRQQVVQRMLDYIHKHYASPMQLGDLAAAVNLNAAYVSSLFHSMVGVPFHRYLEELRLARAKDLLRDPLKRVCEVAYAVGYSNPNHFRNVFRARAGISPSVWRNHRDRQLKQPQRGAKGAREKLGNFLKLRSICRQLKTNNDARMRGRQFLCLLCLLAAISEWAD